MSLSEKLVQLVKQVRPSWNEQVIWACLKEAHEQSHPPPEIIHAMMHAATSPECRTPRGFFMPQHWPTDSKQAHTTPPDCPKHIGKLAHNCGECRAVELAPPDDYEPPPLPNGAPMPDEVRTQINKTRRTK